MVSAARVTRRLGGMGSVSGAVSAWRAAWAICGAVCQRASGAFSNARSTTCRGPGGTSPGSRGMGELRCLKMICTGVSPWNGRCPLRHSYATTPSA